MTWMIRVTCKRVPQQRGRTSAKHIDERHRDCRWKPAVCRSRGDKVALPSTSKNNTKKLVEEIQKKANIGEKRKKKVV